jgi:uncharacterized protein (TIGR00255 family)
MTGYGRAAKSSNLGNFVIEVLSVNRKHLDVSTHLPPEFSCFDVEIKQWTLPRVSRGHITIKVNARLETAAHQRAVPNVCLARQLREACDAVGEDLGMNGSELFLAILPQRPELITLEETFEGEDVYRQTLKEIFEEAFQKFLEMKVKEGVALHDDIAHRLLKVEEEIKKIEAHLPSATTKFREKLTARLEELFSGDVEIEERILREVALYAEKVDISEEIIRFYAHLNGFRELIESPEPCVGKTLEFVLQELSREVNTIGNKSSNLDIAKAVIEIKSELERIREQIQNIE